MITYPVNADRHPIKETPQQERNHGAEFEAVFQEELKKDRIPEKDNRSFSERRIALVEAYSRQQSLYQNVINRQGGNDGTVRPKEGVLEDNQQYDF